MNKLLLVLPLLLILPLVSAVDQTTLEFEQNKEAFLKVPCFNNGSLCSGSATCNLTVIHKGSDVVKNVVMGNQGQYFNYTLTRNKTLLLGDYEATVACRDGGFTGFSTFPFLITPNGNDDSGINQILLLAAAALFSIGLIVIGFYKNEPYIVLFGGIGLFLVGIYVLNNGIGNYRNQLTLAISLISTGLAAFISLKTGTEIIQENM